MTFRLLLSPQAEKDLRKLERPAILRIDQALLELTKNPYPPYVKKLESIKLAQFRIRVGDYRILYDIYSDEKVIYVLRIGHRKDIYR